MIGTWGQLETSPPKLYSFTNWSVTKKTESFNKTKLLNTILGISSNQFGLTGNLELDKNGVRKHFKYCIRKGYLYNEKFVWERVGTCDNKLGLTLEY